MLEYHPVETDRVRRFVWPDLGPDSLQRLSSQIADQGLPLKGQSHQKLPVLSSVNML